MNPTAFLALILSVKSACNPKCYQTRGTCAERSLAAFLASTVLPRSVASLRIRAFTASPSVTATLTSVLRFQLSSSDLAFHGVIYLCKRKLHCAHINFDIPRTTS